MSSRYRHLAVAAGDIFLLVLCLLHVPSLRDRARVPFDVHSESGTLVVDRILDPAACRTLGPGDVVATVADHPLQGDHDFEFETDRRFVGETLILAGNRNGTPLVWSVSLIHAYSVFYIIVTFSVGLITWGLGLFVFLARPGDRASVVLHWAMICMAVSTILMWGSIARSPLESVVTRMVFFAAYMGVGTCLLNFTMVFPETARAIPFPRLAAVYGPGIAMAFGLMIEYMISYARGSVHAYVAFRGLYDAFHILLLAYVGISVANFIASYRRAAGSSGRKKLQWILFGMIMGPLPFLLLIVLPELFVPVSPVPEEYTTAFFLLIPLSFAISIIRYHTFDIEFVINRATVYGISVGMLVIAYIGCVTGMAAALSSFSVPLAAGAAAVIALVFEPLRRRVQGFVDRKFFRTRYDFRRSERGLLEKISKSFSLRQIAFLLVSELGGLIQVEGICFLGKNPSGKWRPLVNGDPGIDCSGVPDDFFASLPASGAPRAFPGAVDEGVLPGAFTRSPAGGIALVVPVCADDRTPIGLLALGPKKSGERFTEEDIDLLTNTADRAGVTMSAIRLHHDLLVREIESEKLKELNTLKSDLVSYVSHEFRTPLTSIRLFAELLEPMVPGNRGEGKEFLRVIAGETDRLNRMVGNLLDTARIERGVKSYAFRKTDASKIVRNVAAALRYQLDKDGFVLRLVGTRRPVPVVADEDALHEALENLLVNAMKYSGAGRKIEVRLSTVNGSVTIAVKDQGVGIPADQREHLFEKFYRAPASRTGVRGVGLGLSLVKNIMAAHNGGVTVQSEPEKGSTFTLSLPAAPRGKESDEDHTAR